MCDRKPDPIKELFGFIGNGIRRGFNQDNTNVNPGPVFNPECTVIDGTITKPCLPYYGNIPNGVSPGTLIVIYGKAPYSQSRFHINLMVGSVITSSLKSYGDIALHFAPRFHENVVVRNNRTTNNWGPEERHGGLPLKLGQDFEIMILAEHRGYKIAVDGHHFTEFLHRVPMTSVGIINIGDDDGVLSINRIEFRREIKNQPAYVIPSVPSVPPVHTGWPSTHPPPIPTYPPQIPQPVICPPAPSVTTTHHSIPPAYNPPIPYRQPIPSGFYPGMMVFISGKPSFHSRRFSINFAVGTSPQNRDIAFHFNCRFDENAIVRNTLKVSGYQHNWGHEERAVPYFPFSPNTNFDMIIRVESNRYMVAVNGQHFVEYNHRILPLSLVNLLEIEGDIIVSSVRYN